MSATSPKRDALLQMILECKPDGEEDFFALSIMTDSDQPTWEAGQTFVGRYEQAAALCVAALGVMAENGRLKKGASVELYEGQKARDFLAESHVQEGRYQLERRGEGNN